jgi:hypothetical protein
MNGVVKSRFEVDIFSGTNLFVHDLKFAFAIRLHMEAPLFACMEHIYLVQVQADAVHGQETEICAVELNIKIYDHAAKIINRDVSFINSCPSIKVIFNGISSIRVSSIYSLEQKRVSGSSKYGTLFSEIKGVKKK